MTGAWEANRLTVSPLIRLLSFGLVAAHFGGCALEEASQKYTASRIDEAIARYRSEAAKVKVGDPKDKVLALLQPTQFELESNEIKGPQVFPTQTASGDDSLIEVHFFRSARHMDEAPDRNGRPLDDDFTPYIFTDDVLTGIGWTTLVTLRFRKPEPHVTAPKEPLCKQLGPMAGCF
jgi:hypothetical protein